jgi:hypothetical protein
MPTTIIKRPIGSATDISRLVSSANRSPIASAFFAIVALNCRPVASSCFSQRDSSGAAATSAAPLCEWAAP